MNVSWEEGEDTELPRSVSHSSETSNFGFLKQILYFHTFLLYGCQCLQKPLLLNASLKQRVEPIFSHPTSLNDCWSSGKANKDDFIFASVVLLLLLLEFCSFERSHLEPMTLRLGGRCERRVHCFGLRCWFSAGTSSGGDCCVQNL